MARAGVLSWFAAGLEQPLIGDQAEIDKRFHANRLRIMIVMTLGYGAMYTCRLGIGIVKKPMIDAGIFSPADFGLIGAALFYSYAFGKFTNGFVADHANVRRLLAVTFLCSALCNLSMGFASTVVVAAVIWGLNGWFQAFGAPACVVAVTSWFSNSERGRAYGTWSMAHSIGESLSAYGIPIAVMYLGWRGGYFAPAAIGATTALCMYVWARDRPRTLGLPTVADWKNDHVAEGESKGKSTVAVQFGILANPTVWIIALSSASIYVTRYAVLSWGVLYLQEARGLSLTAAGALLALSNFMGIIGSVLFGLISDKLFKAKRPPVNLIFALVEIAGLWLIFFGPNTPLALGAGMIIYGLGMTGLVASLGGLFCVDVCPKRATGAAMGMAGVFSYLGAGVQESASGWLIQTHSHMEGAHRVYDFHPAIWLWMGASVFSMLLAATLWNAKPRD